MLEFQITSEQIAAGERLTNDKINRMVRPALTATGTIEAANVADHIIGPGLLDDDVYAFNFGTGGGPAAAYTLTVDPPITAYATGQAFRFLPLVANVANCTLNVSGPGATYLGPKKIVKAVYGAATVEFIPVQDRDMRAGRMVEVVYDASLDGGGAGGGAFILMNETANPIVIYAEDTGSADQVILTPKPSIVNVADLPGRLLLFKAKAANTADTTVTIAGLAPMFLRAAGLPLLPGDIVADQMVACVYDGTNLEIINRRRGTFYLQETVNNIMAANPYLVNHLLGRTPRFATVALACNNAEEGWVAGDQIFLPSRQIAGYEYSWWVNATQFGFASTPDLGRFTIPDKTGLDTFTINNDFWYVRFSATL